MAGNILNGEKPPIPVDREEGVKDLKIIDTIFKVAKTGSRVELG